MRQIKVDDLWQHIGKNIMVPKYLVDDTVDKGTKEGDEQIPCFVLRKDSQEYGSGYYLKERGTMDSYYMEYGDESDTVLMSNTPIAERLDNLITGYSDDIIQLVQEGWSINNDVMNLKDHFDAVEHYVALKNILVS